VEVPEDVMRSISPAETPQGVLSVCALPNQTLPEELSGKRYVVLDGVQDPGNVGTILRTADAFGADGVFLINGCADIYNPKTVRAAMGSLFRVDVRVCTDIAADIGKMRGDGFEIYAAMLDKTSRNVCDLELENGKIGFVIGNEGHGVRESVRSSYTGSVIVPMCEGPESLNAAICASLLSWEVYRSRR
jgi:TrmH family RNA methyltransferase